MGKIVQIRPFKEKPVPMYTLWRELEQALTAAGFPPGRFHRGGGEQSDYEPAVPGPVVRKELIGHTNKDSTSSGKIFFRAHHSVYQLAVDHAGKGRKEAMPKYEAALKAAGFDVNLWWLRFYKKKPVLWVQALFLTHGDGPIDPVDVNAGADFLEEET